MPLTVDDSKKRLQSALALVSAPSVSVDSLRSVRTLIAGINPLLDQRLQEAEKNFALLEHVQNGTLLLAGAENLPETTEEEKRRKKFILLFIKSWGDLKAEVVRVQNELNSQQSGAGSGSVWWRIFKNAKGPLALITVIAVAVALMAQTSVAVVIENNGCGTLYANTSVPVSIPGLSLPNQNIENGQSATATIPPLPVTVDGTKSGTLSLSAVGLNLSIQLSSSVKDVTFDSVSLLDKVTSLDLASKKSHTLTLDCK